MSQANVISELPELTWRNLAPVPVEDASYDFAHDQVERRYPYVDGAGHDHTGRGPIKVTAKLLFLNTLQPGLYPHTWEDWRTALLDGSAGELVHPELGSLNARVLNGSVRLMAQVRAGVSVEVAWVESLKDPAKGPDEISVLSISLQEAARAADSACTALGIDYPMVIDPPSTDLLGAIKALEGQVFAAQLAAAGAVNQVLGTVRQMVDAAERLVPSSRTLGSASPSAALYNLGIVEQGLLALLDNARRSARPVGRRRVEVSTTLDAFATSVGNTIAEVIELNPTALRAPSVSPGTTLLHYLDA